jgi:hypothetical protein
MSPAGHFMVTEHAIFQMSYVLHCIIELSLIMTDAGGFPDKKHFPAFYVHDSALVRKLQK